MNESTANRGALSDLRVRELGTLIAGPFCGQLLSDMGAEVIKIEAPGQGDPMRHWGPQQRGQPSTGRGNGAGGAGEEEREVHEATREASARAGSPGGAFPRAGLAG